MSRSLVYLSLYLIFSTGFILTSYAQPLFPPHIKGNGIAGPTTAPSVSQTFGIDQTIGSGELFLINAINALKSGDTKGFSENLSQSEQQFASVLQSPTQSSNASNYRSIALGGTYLVRALQSSNSSTLNENLNQSLKQFAPSAHIFPWTMILEPPQSGADGGGSGGAGMTGMISDVSELLAHAGIHISVAISALERQDMNTLNENLIVAYQQAQMAFAS